MSLVQRVHKGFFEVSPTAWFGPCIVCGNSFGFNPGRVPHLSGKPICCGCIGGVNQRRAEEGNPEIPVYLGCYVDCVHQHAY